MTEKLKLSMEEADLLVKTSLLDGTDCDEALTIRTFFENNNVSYEILSKDFIRGHVLEKRTCLKKMEYITFLKLALSKRGYSVQFVKPVFRKNKVSYEIFFYLLEKEDEMQRKRKR